MPVAAPKADRTSPCLSGPFARHRAVEGRATPLAAARQLLCGKRCAHIVKAYIIMAYIVMAYIVMTYIGMASLASEGHARRHMRRHV